MLLHISTLVLSMDNVSSFGEKCQLNVNDSNVNGWSSGYFLDMMLKKVGD